MAFPICFHDLGQISYRAALEKQLQLQGLMVSGQSSDNHLLLCEHEPVITSGLSGNQANLLVSRETLAAKGIAYYQTSRGGDLTYHGPGQVTGYPIFDLKAMGLGVRQYVTMIEECIIGVMEQFHIAAGRKPGAAGVWLDVGMPGKERKICAIGVQVSRGVTMHGFALNVCTDLSSYQYINPCGFAGSAVTNLEQELGRPEDIKKTKALLKKGFCEVFQLNGP